MKSLKATCLVLFVGLTCVGLALVAGAPGQQPATPAPSGGASTGTAVPAPAGAATTPTARAVAAPENNRFPYAAEPAAARADMGVEALGQAQQLGAQNSLQQLDNALNSTRFAPPAGRGYGGLNVDPEAAEREKWTGDVMGAETRQERLLAKYAQTADEKQRAEIKAELSKVLERQFDLQMQQREREVTQIEARVKKLREMIEKRKSARQTIVTGRLDQLLNEADGMGWVAPTGGGRMSRGPYGAYGPAYRSSDPFVVPLRTAPATKQPSSNSSSEPAASPKS